ncbi:hypothetical protein [Bradyrhizobium sp. Tv2a-2]|uniref:hypothetical protein n=1 Tax=Bradyrhizobium sp. Tv2a-2 TaxID=113395 RepID=UPI0004090CCD|nr:hypothetical protein [Bradyrhizobium sp. Tv2a-2]
MSFATLPDVPMDEVIATSYRDFHVKGFDYICLRRSPSETVKLYFFDGDVSKLPEVVNPHDHRYDFTTLCVAGRVQNMWFSESRTGELFQRFAYETPLLGGDGFTWVGETRLSCVRKYSCSAGRRYSMRHHEVHTIRLMENNTVISLVQFEDKVSDFTPTLTFTRDREPPSLDGLYRRFEPDAILSRLKALQERVRGLRLPRIV